ncbi:MAG: hypothetical protein K8R23_13530 [Chthoniobacter sp.]|nr:hypothetical protein [Chthoniobacter sp.]
MEYLIMMSVTYLLAFLPLGFAFAGKNTKWAAVTATVLSLATLAGQTFIYRGLFAMGGGNPGFPVVVAIYLGLVSLVGGGILFFKSCE